MSSKKTIHISDNDKQLDISKILDVISAFLSKNKVSSIVIDDEWRKNSEKIHKELNEILRYDKYNISQKNITLNLEVERIQSRAPVSKRERVLYINFLQESGEVYENIEIIANILSGLNCIRKSVILLLRNFLLGRAPMINILDKIEMHEYSNPDLQFLFDNIEDSKIYTSDSRKNKIINFAKEKSIEELEDLENIINAILGKRNVNLSVSLKFKYFLRLFLPMFSFYVLNKKERREKEKEDFINDTFQKIKKKKRDNSNMYLSFGFLSLFFVICINVVCFFDPNPQLPLPSTPNPEYIKQYINYFALKIPLLFIDILLIYVAVFLFRQYSLYSKVVELYECYGSLIDSDHYYENHSNMEQKDLIPIRTNFINEIIYLSDKIKDLIENHEKSPKAINSNSDGISNLVSSIINKIKK